MFSSFVDESPSGDQSFASGKCQHQLERDGPGQDQQDLERRRLEGKADRLDRVGSGELRSFSADPKIGSFVDDDPESRLGRHGAAEKRRRIAQQHDSGSAKSWQINRHLLFWAASWWKVESRWPFLFRPGYSETW